MAAVPESGERNCSNNQNRLEIPKYGYHGPAGSGGGFHGGIAGAIQSVCHTCKVGHSNAQRYPTCMKNQGGHLNFMGICLIDDFIFLLCLIYCFIFLCVFINV